MSFRLKTILGIALIEALLLALLISSVLTYLTDSHDRELNDHTRTTGRLVAALIQDALISSDLATLESLAENLVASERIRIVQISDADGLMLVEHYAPNIRSDAIHSVSTEVSVADIRYGRVRLGFDIQNLQSVAEDVRTHSFTLAGAEMLLVALFSFMLGNYLTRQLRALSVAAKHVGEGDFDYRVITAGSDELAQTATAFNDMTRQLKRNTARLSAILDSSPDAIISLDEQGCVLDYNPAAEQLFGLSAHEVVGKSLEQSLPSLLHGVHGLTGGSDSLGHARRVERTVDNAAGVPLFVELGVSRTQSGQGLVTTLFLRDMRERIEREDYLRKLLRAVEQSPASVVITDTRAIIEYVNQRFVEVTGYSEQEAIGQNPRILKSGHTPPKTYLEMWQCLNEGRTWKGDLVNRKKSGELYWEQATISPIRDHHGVITNYLAVKEDISVRKEVEEALKGERDFSMRIIERAPGIILGIDCQGRLHFINKAGEQITGFGRDELQGSAWRDRLFPGKLAERVAALFVKLPNGPELREFEAPIRNRNGELRTIAWNTVHRYDDHGELEEIIGFGDDITEQRAIEQHVRAERAFLQSIIDGVADPIMVIDGEYRVLLMNSAARANASALDLPPGEPPRCYQVSHHRDDPCSSDEHPCPLRKVFETGQPTTVIHQHYDADGEPRQHELIASPLLTDDGELRGIIESSRDVTEHLHTIALMRDQRLHMQHLAQHDMLTSLPNRMLFMDRLAQAIREARREQEHFAVLFLDLDRFKQVNDSLGHAVGDKLLQEVASRLSATVREVDSIGRIGGDEFVILIRHLVHDSDAGQVAQKVIDSLHGELNIAKHSLYITASVGISIYPHDAQDGESLLKHADAAMYQAKESGRNGYQFYTAEMTQQAYEQLRLEYRMQLALEQGLFKLYYQPQVDLTCGRVFAVEALLRWHDSEFGEVEPSRFIPIAEESGLILRLGRWVLEEACQQLMAWRAAGGEIETIAVNLSPMQLQQSDLVEQVRDVLEQTGCPPEALELEITEGAIMARPEQALEQLIELRKMGVALAVDDFGTGHASFGYLKRLPLTRLKIDHSFISQLHDDPADEGIVAAIIAVAQHMQMKITAEGVELPTQRNLLLHYGCVEGQGFLYSHAVPSEAITDLLASGGLIPSEGDTNAAP